MKSLLYRISLLSFFIFSSFLISAAVDDPDPNSPVPVLLSSNETTRVLAVDAERWNGRLVSDAQRVFYPGRSSVVVVFVTNVTLMKGEGANAFRVYLRQQSGKTFEMPVEDAVRVGQNTYALKVRLYDVDGYRGQPLADGDSAIYLSWRGLASNYLKIALGKEGGTLALPQTNASISGARTRGGPVSEYVGYRWSGDRMRFLEQATFGPSAESDMRLRRIGLRTWLAEQFEAPYPTYPFPNPVQMPTGIPTDCQPTTNHLCYRTHYTMTPLQTWFFIEAMYGSAQLRHRVAWALSQIWVTSGVTTQQSSHQIAYHKILTNNAFGNYRTLMREATLSPTMGNYLDMVRSTRANPNENYPREILQLFSIGLYMLNPDGTRKLDNQGEPIPTYSQETINNLSKVFTGWTYCNAGCPSSSPGILNYKDPMVLSPANHDLTAKTLLDYPGAVDRDIEACSNCTTNGAITAYADQSLDKAINNIFNHPNVGPYIGRLLIQHMVTSDPSPAYVERVAAVFNNNGDGVRGDLKAVIRAILLDPEARGDVKTDPRYGKLREPVQLMTNMARIFPAMDYNGLGASDGALHNLTAPLGQNPFYSPTVFNYFEFDYVIPATTVLSPEFQLLNTATSVKKTNALYTLIFEGVTPNATDSLRGTSLNYSGLLPHAVNDATGNQLLDAASQQMLHGTLSTEHRNLILSAVQAVPATDPILRVKTVVYLIAASSQYQVQR